MSSEGEHSVRSNPPRPAPRTDWSGSIRDAARAAAGPLAGLAVTWVFLCLTPFGRKLDALAYHGRFGTAHKVRVLDLLLLETIAVASVVLGLGVLVLVAGVRGEWRLGLRAGGAVLGALLSVEMLKLVLPTVDFLGQVRWPAASSFPSGHTVVVASISLAVLSVGSDAWRRRLVGPLVAWTAVATTATVTLGWHRPSDVLGSFFLATAWHRALGARRPTTDQLRRLVPSAAVWWSAACLLVLGAAIEGVASGRAIADGGRHEAVAYLCALAGLLTGAVITITAGVGDRRPPVPCRPVPESTLIPPDRGAPPGTSLPSRSPDRKAPFFRLREIGKVWRVARSGVYLARRSQHYR